MKKLLLSAILVSKFALGSSLEILEYRFEEAKTMSTEKTMWGFGASEKETGLKTLLKDTTQAFQKEEDSLQKSIQGLQSVLKQSSLNNLEINSQALILFIICPILWPFLPILWPLLLTTNSYSVDRRYTQEQIRQQIEKIYELQQSRSIRYSNLIIRIKEELKTI